MGNRKQRFSLQGAGATAARVVSHTTNLGSAIVMVALLLLGMAASPVRVAAQQSCAPIDITILSTPGINTGAYTLFMGGGVSLVDDDNTIVLIGSVSWQTTNPTVGGNGAIGTFTTQYLSASFNNQKNYVMWLQVTGASYAQTISTFTDFGGFNDADVFVTGVYSRTFPGYAPGNWNKMHLRVDGGPPKVDLRITGVWKITIMEAGCGLPEPPEPPEPPKSDYCLDGYEVVTDTVTLATGATWTGEMAAEAVGWERYYVRYTFRDTPENLGLHHYLELGINDALIQRDVFSPRGQYWENGAWVNEPFWFSVPNRHFSMYADFDPTGYVTGTTASLSVYSGYNPIELVSACVVPTSGGPSELCPDGVEVLDEEVYLDALTGSWETTVDYYEATHIVVRYTVENPSMDPTHSWLLGKFMVGIEYALYYVEATVPTLGGQISFTLPTTGVVKLYDDELYLEFYNRNWPMALKSVCIIDGTEDYMEHLDPEQCGGLENPDFVYDVDGWNTQGSVTWSDLEENGAVDMQSGQVWQPAAVPRGEVRQLEVRAKDNGGSALVFGTSRKSIVSGGYQTKTVALSDYYSLYPNEIFVMPGDPVLAASDGAWVDYVCLVDAEGLIVVGECDLPLWDPEGSGDSLIIYVFKFIFDVLKWVVCEIVRAISMAVNWLWKQIKNIVYRIPPDMPIWDWLMQAAEGFLDYFGITIADLRKGVVDYVINPFALWIKEIVNAVIWWIADLLDMDPYDLIDMLMLIWNEAGLFFEAIRIEVMIEIKNAGRLFIDMADVFIILGSGVREGVSGNRIELIGTDMTGLGAYIWDGVDFLNEVLADTPMSALNVVLLGAMAFGLLIWTGIKLKNVIEAVQR